MPFLDSFNTVYHTGGGNAVLRAERGGEGTG